jgi:hypothetical protein
MKKIFVFLSLTVVLSSCKKELRDSNTRELSQQENQLKKPPPPPPPNANPVFAFLDYKKISNQLTVPAIYVMDANGANATAVYTNYSGQGNNTVVNRPDFPAWSGNGTQLCFILNSADLYTLNISLVNGVTTGSGAIKIGDGVAGGGSYKQGKWRPGFNQIACVWKKTGDPDKIHSLPSAGGSATVLYTAASSDWIIENDIAFKSDGSNLVFSERQISTGDVFLKVLDVATSQIIKTIDLSQYHSVREMDWAKSQGSNIVAITTVNPLCTTPFDNNGYHNLQTVDVSSASPSLTWLKNDVGNISFSPNDTQITIPAGLSRGCNPANGCCISSYFNFRIYTIASGTTSNNISAGNNPDWKR